ncbi:hypothetical protein FGM00_17945 [Aggregatimonas sangjinii]|uniref:Phospholipase/carboxylesterase/thioesterase domain-containing protein n=1 Tax=Aggregatimonas sangjinii TaxID=2583587 RepID=A0A5B7SXI2_9FLAO|nr:hypothetical protein [Aggregatimonas sangjinii]QCX01903.1 hypothetical protein FGM00_17945 [Aggregatimonas sangjinii]
MKNVFVVFVGCFVLGMNAQATFETKVVIDSIPVANTANETFALYLPSDYRSDILSPILFVFSPSGNGRKGVEAFRDAAETYNYILVCSNNARNGPYERNFGIAERLFTHIFSNFNIKEKRIYLAGFSGGSRLVSAIASLTDQIEGVIACGAGFSQIPYHKPSIQKYAYAGVCGDRDMNYREMIDVKSYLNKLKFVNTLFTFEGNHRWPPSEQIVQAFDWLEMESVKKGNLQKSKAEIRKSYLRNYDFTKTIDSETQPLLAYEHYERLLASYKRFFMLDSIANKMQVIQESNSYSEQLNTRKKLFERERDLDKVFIGRFNRDYEKPEKVNMKWWRKEFQKLDKLKEDKFGQREKMLSRFRYRFYAIIYTKLQSGVSEPSPAQKSFCKELYGLIYPKIAD